MFWMETVAASSRPPQPRTNRVGVDPNEKIATAVTNRTTNLHERRTSQPDSPGLQRPDGKAQEVGGILLPKESVCVLGNSVR